MSTKLCGARTKAGGTCQQPAGRGTDHLGWGHCHFHFGNTTNGRLYSAREEMVASLVVMGQAGPMTPDELIQMAVDQAAAKLRFCARKVRELDEQDTVGPVVTTVDRRGESGYSETRKGPPMAHIWVRLHSEAIDQASRVAKMALDANVAERQVSVVERLGDDLGDLLARVLQDPELGLTADQLRVAAPVVIRRHLTAIEGTATPVIA